MIAHGRDDAHRLRHTLVDVRKLCAALGLLKGAKPQARGLLVLCPWHAEKHASCSVTLGPDGTVRTHCFTCQVSGDALALIARVRELDVKTQFRQVLAEAARIAGSEPVRRYEPAPNPERSTLDAASYSAVAARLLELCSLEKERDVLEYLERRKLVVAAWQARVSALPAPGKQDALVQALLRDFEPATLELAGLVRKGQGLIFPFHRLIIPWRGLDASIDVLQRRRVDDDEPKKKYVLPPRRRPFYPFGAEQLGPDTAERDVTFVEGAIDVLALRVLARRDRILILPLGIPGVGAWRKEWAVLAKGRAVRIAFDADAAGERNVAAVARDLRAAGATRVRRWTPTAAKDWAGCLESGAA
ncbi:MAG TPA: toprim domain-containing protein [Polyangiaceae bacterium]|nr:toprim domain-containing protein [Polyangiaceae bacterium]